MGYWRTSCRLPSVHPRTVAGAGIRHAAASLFRLIACCIRNLGRAGAWTLFAGSIGGAGSCLTNCQYLLCDLLCMRYACIPLFELEKAHIYPTDQCHWDPKIGVKGKKVPLSIHSQRYKHPDQYFTEDSPRISFCDTIMHWKENSISPPFLQSKESRTARYQNIGRLKFQGETQLVNEKQEDKRQNAANNRLVIIWEWRGWWDDKKYAVHVKGYRTNCCCKWKDMEENMPNDMRIQWRRQIIIRE